MTKATMGMVFGNLKVQKVAGTRNEYSAVEFTFVGRKMIVGYSAKEGAKMYWTVTGKGTRQTSRTEFFQWMKNFEGPDAKKVVGYVKHLSPVSMGPVVSQCCVCRRGVDARVYDFSMKKYGEVRCRNHQPAAKQEKQPAATKGSGRATIGSVPVFGISELMTFPMFKLRALLNQIEKAMTRIIDEETGDKLSRYLRTVGEMMGAEQEAMEFDEDTYDPGTSDTVCCSCHKDHGWISPQGICEACLDPNSPLHRADTEFHNATSGSGKEELTDGVKEDSEAQRLEDMSLTALRKECRSLGIKGMSKAKKPELIQVLLDHMVQKNSMVQVLPGEEAPF